ncbi:MAG: AAA family ATPase, partial [bacterium]|nr:AAA family ATPase [bacterium]
DIHENPTDDRGSYLILKFNFSLVDPDIDKMAHSFLHYVRQVVREFMQKYSALLLADTQDHLKSIDETSSASDVLFTLLSLCRSSRQKLYVIIDEYDNFANTVLSTIGQSAYEKLTRGTGFLRSFFNVIKGGTDGSGAPFSRLFLTGVSPITLDDVTSGYNIGINISMEHNVNRMLGFTEEDVAKLIEYYGTKGRIKHQTPILLDIMTQWYGNYLFSEDDEKKLFNSDMVLYFISKYLTREKFPKDLVDRNVRIDYGKLRHLILVDKDNGKGKTTNGNFTRLKEILEKEEIKAELKSSFPLEKLHNRRNFLSLLFAFGLLTIKSSELNEQVLAIPNETIRRLYYDYIMEAYEETGAFSMDLDVYNRLMKNMAINGQWEPLFDLITNLMRESMSLRDMITGEKSVQAFLNVYLGLSNLFIIHPEKELNKGYADLLMEPFLARYEGIKYSYLLEIKYLKREGKITEKRLEKLKTTAKEQLNAYSLDEKFKKNIEKTTLIKLILIFKGHDLIYSGSAG